MTCTPVWLDAAWHAPGLIAAPIPFDPCDRGLLLGDGAFDTALVLGHRMVWRDVHAARLVAGCGTLGFALERARVERAIDAMLPQVVHGSLRLTATRGPGPRGLLPPADPRPTLIATTAPLRRDALFAPLRLRTSVIRRNETSPLARIKALNYADAALATAEARRMGDDEPLFLNVAGAACCAGTANLFALLDGCLLTPPLIDGVLDGAARRALLAAAARLGLPAREASLAPGDLRRADAVLLTNSLRLVAPVAALDGQPLAASAQARSLAEALATLVAEDCGTDPRSIA